MDASATVRKHRLLRHFPMRTDRLPRRARDKHQETLKQAAFSAGVPFEPVCNCPGVAANWGSAGITGQEEKFLSESWIGAISGGMLDVLVFIEEGDINSDAVMYNYARQAAEIGPSFRGRPFGSEGAALTVNASAVGAPTTSPHAGFNRIGGEDGWRLRAAVWEENAAAPAVIRAHVVVTNLDMENPLLFTFELGGRMPPPSTDVDGTCLTV